MSKYFSEFSNSFKSLGNKVFAKLYLAETISLLGDAFTWVGLALLAYQFDKERSASILATALTLRVKTMDTNTITIEISYLSIFVRQINEKYGNDYI